MTSRAIGRTPAGVRSLPESMVRAVSDTPCAHKAISEAEERRVMIRRPL